MEVLRANIARETRGAYLAFTLALFGMLIGGTLSYTGRSLLGLSTIIASLATLATTFIYSKSQQNSERARKESALMTKRMPGEPS